MSKRTGLAALAAGASGASASLRDAPDASGPRRAMPPMPSRHGCEVAPAPLWQRLLGRLPCWGTWGAWYSARCLAGNVFGVLEPREAWPALAAMSLCGWRPACVRRALRGAGWPRHVFCWGLLGMYGDKFFGGRPPDIVARACSPRRAPVGLRCGACAQVASCGHACLAGHCLSASAGPVGCAWHRRRDGPTACRR